MVLLAHLPLVYLMTFAQALSAFFNAHVGETLRMFCVRLAQTLMRGAEGYYDIGYNLGTYVGYVAYAVIGVLAVALAFSVIGFIIKMIWRMLACEE